MDQTVFRGLISWNPEFKVIGLPRAPRVASPPGDVSINPDQTNSLTSRDSRKGMNQMNTRGQRSRVSVPPTQAKLA